MNLLVANVMESLGRFYDCYSQDRYKSALQNTEQVS